MLLIPGIALTTSLRDMINGDTISGLLGLSEAVLKALEMCIRDSRRDSTATARPSTPSWRLKTPYWGPLRMARPG